MEVALDVALGPGPVVEEDVAVAEDVIEAPAVLAAAEEVVGADPAEADLAGADYVVSD